MNTGCSTLTTDCMVALWPQCNLTAPRAPCILIHLHHWPCEHSLFHFIWWTHLCSSSFNSGCVNASFFLTHPHKQPSLYINVWPCPWTPYDHTTNTIFHFTSWLRPWRSCVLVTARSKNPCILHFLMAHETPRIPRSIYGYPQEYLSTSFYAQNCKHPKFQFILWLIPHHPVFCCFL